VDETELRAAASDVLNLSPSVTDKSGLAKWLGVSVGLLDSVAVFPPALSPSIRLLEERENQRIPNELRELLRHADGLSQSGVSVLGVDDLFVVELTMPYWNFAMDEDTGARYLLNSEGIWMAPGPDAGPEELIKWGRLSDLHRFVQSVIQRRRGDDLPPG
jgi:hypothetical protein